MCWVFLHNEEPVDELRVCIDEADDGCEEVAASDIPLFDIFGADQLLQPILGFIPQDVVLVLVKKVVGVIELGGDVDLRECLFIGRVETVCKIQVVLYVLLGYLSKYGINLA